MIGMAKLLLQITFANHELLLQITFANHELLLQITFTITWQNYFYKLLLPIMNYFCRGIEGRHEALCKLLSEGKFVRHVHHVGRAQFVLTRNFLQIIKKNVIRQNRDCKQN